ncbi:hypothetical protein ACOMHN_011864 [Nucella lapillus]
MWPIVKPPWKPRSTGQDKPDRSHLAEQKTTSQEVSKSVISTGGSYGKEIFSPQKEENKGLRSRDVVEAINKHVNWSPPPATANDYRQQICKTTEADNDRVGGTKSQSVTIINYFHFLPQGNSHHRKHKLLELGEQDDPGRWEADGEWGSGCKAAGGAGRVIGGPGRKRRVYRVPATPLTVSLTPCRGSPAGRLRAQAPVNALRESTATTGPGRRGSRSPRPPFLQAPKPTER